MASKVDSSTSVVVVSGTDVPQRYPRALGRQPLRSINDVGEELARVYRAVCQGKIAADVGTKLTYILREMVKTIEVAKIEPALELLEQERVRQTLNR